MIQHDKSSEDTSLCHPSTIDPAGGQVQFCHNLIASLFEKGNS